MPPAEHVVAIVPVKAWWRAKSRLDVPAGWRPRCAEAFARDVLDALAVSGTVAGVVLVTEDEDVRAVFGGRGITVTPDPGGTLDAAVAAGVGAVGHWSGRVVVVPSDLPALTAETFDDAVTLLAAHDRSFIRDVEGDGTTLVSAARPGLLLTAYGPGSARKHVALGLADVDGSSMRVRRDVDTVEHLTEVAVVGVGAHTAAVLCELRPGGRGSAAARPSPSCAPTS